MDAILHMSPTQLSLFDAVIRHAAGKDPMDERFYPGLSTEDFDELQGFSQELYDDLLSHTHSPVALARWHRKHMTAGGAAAVWGKVVKFGGKAINFAKKAWNTVAKIGKKLASYGKRLGTWVVKNPQAITAIAGLIQTGMSVKAALEQGGAPAAIESAAAQVTQSAATREKMSKYADTTDADTDDAPEPEPAPETPDFT